MSRQRKYYHSHSLGAFITGFALLAFVGLFALFVFSPVFSIKNSSEILEVNGFDYITIGLGKYIRQLGVSSFPIKDTHLLNGYYSDYSGDNPLLTTVTNYHAIFFTVLAGIFVFSLIFVFIELILAIFWLLRGRIQFPGASASLGWTSFAFFALDIGLLYAYLYFTAQIVNNASDPAEVAFAPQPFLLLAGVFVLALLISIVHIAGYRDRRYKKRVKHFDEQKEGAPIEDRNDNEEEPEPDKRVPDKELPQGLTEIGDHAFAKDSSLTSARIPSGIKSLGPSAFSNCHNLKYVSIPLSVKEIGYNCFFNANRLTRIDYAGTKNEWSRIFRGSNWLTNAGTTVVNTIEGPITVDPKN